jgi:hypothetical protein
MIEDPRNAARYLLTLFGLAALITLILLLTSGYGHASTTSTAHGQNTFGALIYNHNPNTYLAGSILDYAIVGQSEGLSMRVKPLATYMLFDENVLFCGVPADKINGHENPMVLVYERVDHRMIDGVGCHDLLEVRDVK